TETGLDIHRYICNALFGLEALNVPEVPCRSSGNCTRRARSASNGGCNMLATPSPLSAACPNSATAFPIAMRYQWSFGSECSVKHPNQGNAPTDQPHACVPSTLWQ